MEEREFLSLADTMLFRIEEALEKLQADSDVSWDYETKPGGILELDFEDGSKIIINRHTAAQEIWIAAKSGGFHFKPPADPTANWRDTRGNASLGEVLSRCISEQSGVMLQLSC